MAIATNRESETDELNNKRDEGLHMVVHLPMISEVLPAEEGEAEGCIQCQQGRKLVLFVTGKCHWGCDYCPLSENRRESPDMFANERRCSTWDEVIEEANRLDYGLAAYAYTNSAKTAQDLGAEIESGMVSINHHGLGLVDTPFGGVKDSGYGSEGGPEGLEAYMTTKFVSQVGL